ncbi:DUF397 domain-containing protein [Streptomyces sudanensis]|uniref:DUF397 domain-containing protein n=1 Tax=Streptomyces sudanensis TaxID=436397 RepID=A0ABY4TIA3_9ACTN|nr:MULTISPECIES: DUF397 domain-containing protein [Streptomyces]MCP9957688.1 DUF397 domain-containing protein [Streptomyces sudanensis]MCP9986806.1 DUF397 domain-containing protein [Streptomyces sudanensis]MCQ0001770.1 DUF397 domain-containing protein [Streptomyces sudanensis]URN18633.1 DUF397 domain-containing protein [Streptomyces sudanensis]
MDSHQVSRELDGARWFKSSYSGSTGQDCVEAAMLPEGIAVRDSKNPGGGAFAVPAGPWGVFLDALCRV